MTSLALIPLLPLLAAGMAALLPRRAKGLSASLAIGAMGVGFVLSCGALYRLFARGNAHGVPREYWNFDWIAMGGSSLKLGLVLDPMTAVMLVMITFVGSLIFIFSVGYMAHDDNAARFFCFLSLFAAAMLGLVVSNSLLLLFMCWELVGLASYLLIGFWFQKPSAAAAAKKAFITTRIGDIGFFLGLLWLQAETGTLLCYDDGRGCLEAGALERLVAQTTMGGMAVSGAIGLLLFCGAMGKSGQVPLHVWLPDAMEGPTPVSALIHAATMVAAGVFLIARVHPLLAATVSGPSNATLALQVVTWVGAITAVFAACIATAQTDIKRILAYSTVSQLGYMFMGVGAGGVAVGMFHLITHAFFKALLFLGSGSIIHGCDGEQDIRRMGGLKRFMPVTFVTYAVGMLALSGVPIFFSGFWSKDEILHATMAWPVSKGPFLLGLCGAVLTAFYMTRQMVYLFAGPYRGTQHADSETQAHGPHESPAVMTVPLMLLAAGAVILGFLGTPAWPWFASFLEGRELKFEFGALVHGSTLGLIGLSTLIVAAGLGAGWKLYAGASLGEGVKDPLEIRWPRVFGWLRDRLYVDEVYGKTVVTWNRCVAEAVAWAELWIVGGVVKAVAWVALLAAWVSRVVDDGFMNFGFDRFCQGLKQAGLGAGFLQNGDTQRYLRILGLALVALIALLAWGGGRS